MSKPRRLVIASGNQGKIREFQGLLSSLSLEVVAQPDGIDVEENGSTFAANARIKAEAVAKRTGHWALADDSGLSVEALDGAPGVHSARYAQPMLHGFRNCWMPSKATPIVRPTSALPCASRIPRATCLWKLRDAATG